jgi:hypothetical protein
MVIALIALFVSLGGSAVALSGSNTVFTDDITDNEVRTADVRNDTLAGGGLGATDLKPSSVGTSEVALNSLTGADVNESGLGIVPNANQLDGLDSSAFARGAISNARASALGDTAGTTVITAAGYGHIELNCSPGASTVSLRYVNDTGSSRYLAESTSSDIYFSDLVPNGGQFTASGGAGATFVFDISDEASPQRIAHIDASATAGGAVAGLPDECRAVATAIIGPGDS